MPKLPDVEFMIVIQWMVLVGAFVVFTTFVSTWASSKAKEIYFGKDPKRRKEDTTKDDWFNRLIEAQNSFTTALIGLTKELNDVKDALKRSCKFRDNDKGEYLNVK